MSHGKSWSLNRTFSRKGFPWRVLLLTTLIGLMVGGASAASGNFSDGFEDQDFTEYSDSSSWEIQGTTVFEGSYAAHSTGSSTTSKLEGNFPNNVSISEIRWDFRLYTSGTSADRNFFVYGDDSKTKYTLYCRLNRNGNNDLDCYSGSWETAISSIPTGSWHRIVFKNWDDANNQVDVYMDGNFQNTVSLRDEEVGDTLNAFYFDAGSNEMYLDEIYNYNPNQAPQFNSTSITPDPPKIGNNVSYSAEVYDADGSIQYTNLTVYDDSSKVVDNAQRTGTTPSWKDVYKPTEGDLDAYFETVDDAGAVTTKWLNRTLTDSAPAVTLSDPDNQSYFKYDVPLSFSVSDSDSKPAEDWNCDVDKDGSLNREVYLKEGTNSSYSDSLRSDLGSHSTNVSCTDGAGNTGSNNSDYEVSAFRINSVSTSEPVYETDNVTYSANLDVGAMVENYNMTLFYNGADRKTVSKDGSGAHAVVNVENYYRPKLIPSEPEHNLWKQQFDVNLSDISSGYEQLKRNSSEKNQSVEYAYHSPSVSIQESRVIEKENIQTVFSYTDELNGGPADVSRTTSFNGSNKGGETNSFDTPLVGYSDKDTFTASGTLSLTFEGSSRSMSASTDSVDVYKKILTDCSNSVNGVTGTRALTFELRNEENQTQTLRGTIDFNFDTTHHGEHTRNYAFENKNQTKAKVCIYPSWAEYNATGPVIYESLPDQNKLDLTFPDRSYRLYNEKLNNQSETVKLYLLKDSLATEVFFKVVDNAGNPIPDVTIKTMRYFVGQDSFLTVAKGKTDSEGKTVTHLRVNQINYKHVLTKGGNVLKETGAEIIACESTPCTVRLQVGSKISPYFQKEAGFSYSINKLKDSDGNITGLEATVNHDSGSIDNATFFVEKTSVIGWKTVCDISTSSTSQTMVCEFNDSASGATYKYSLTSFKDNEKFFLTSGTVGKPKGLFGKSNPWAGALIFLVVTGIGLVSPKTSVAFSTAGVVIAWWTGLLTLALPSVASLVIIAAFVVMTGET